MRAIALLAMTCIFMICGAYAQAGLTDYQRGVAEGLNTGFYMGELFGMAQYSNAGVEKYNSQLDQYNQWLMGIFTQDRDALERLTLPPLVYSNPVGINGPKPDVYGRIGGYPAPAYYAQIGAGLENQPSEGLGGV